MEKIEADLRGSKLKQRSLSKAYESLRAQASSLVTFSLQWGDLEDHLESTWKSIETRFRELERREKDVEAQELKAGELQGLIDQKSKELIDGKKHLISLENLIRKHSDEVIVQERRLREVEEVVRVRENQCELVENRFRDGTEKLNSVEKSVEVKEEEVERLKISLNKLVEEVELKEKELNENLWLIEVHEKEIGLKKEMIKAAQTRSEECDKEVVSKEEKLGSIRKSLEACSKLLESREKRMSEFDLKEEDFGLLRKSMEAWSSKLVFRERELDVKQKQVGEQQKLVQDGENRLDAMSKGLEIKERELEDKSTKLDLKEKELDLIKTSTEEHSEKVKSKERHLEDLAKALELKQNKFASIKKSTEEHVQSLKSKERLLADQFKELELNLLELVSIKKSIKEQGQSLKSKERQLEGQAKELEVKRIEFVSIKKSTEEQTQILEARQKEIEVQAKEFELKSKECDLKKHSIEELTRNLKVKEGQLEHQTKELELKQREFDSMKKSREEQTRNLKEKVDTSVLHPQVKTEPLEYTPSNNTVVPSCTSTSILSGTNRDGRGLQLFMNDHLKRIGLVGDEVSAVLQASSDPAKLVLDAMEGFYPSNSTLANSQCDFDLGVIRRSCIVLLDSLTRVSPEIYPWVRQEAIKLAGEWKAKMTTEFENWLEILGFLRLVHAFKITSAYDAKELQSLIGKVGENEQATELSRSLGNTDMASGGIIWSPVKIEQPECSLVKDAGNVSSQQSATKDPAIVSSPNLGQTAANDAANVSFPVLQHTAVEGSAVVSSPSLLKTAAKDGATVSSPNLQQTAAKVAATVSSSNLQQTAAKSAAVSSPNLHQTAAKVAAAVSSPNLPQIATTGEWNLQGFVDELNKGNHLTYNETLAALQRSSDPEKFVLDLMQRSLTLYWGNKDARSEGTVMLSYIHLLEQLMVVVPHGSLHMKFDALKLALQWKAKMGADTLNPLEQLGFLQFIATYGLISNFPEAQIVRFLQRISQHRQTPELRPALAFADKLPAHFISNFIEMEQLISAVRVICTFKLVETFPPIPLLKKFVVTRTNFFRRLCVTKKSLEKEKVLDDEIIELRAVIKCMEDCNLESEDLSRNIGIQIAAQEKMKEAYRSSKAYRACKLEQEQKDRSVASMVEQNENQEAIPSNVVQQEQKGSPAAKFAQQGQNRCLVRNVEQQELHRFGQQKQKNEGKRSWNEPAPIQKRFKQSSGLPARGYLPI